MGLFHTLLEQKFDAFMDEMRNLYLLDIIKVTRPLTVEEKAHCLRIFMAPATNQYNPRVLVATCGASNARIDSNDIYSVFCLGMPSTSVDMVQERGRAGCFEGANPTTCLYDLNFLMSSFNYQLIQILNNKETVLEESYRTE